MLTVELDKPSILTFKGAGKTAQNKRGQLVLSPGDNQVEEQTFLRAWKNDALMKSYYATGQISIYTEDGARYEPPDAPRLLRRNRSAEAEKKPVYKGASIAPSVDDKPPGSVPTSELRPPSAAPEREEEAPAQSVEPQMMGGGVPGSDLVEASANVIGENDLGKLKSWMDNEKRDSVLKVLSKRISDLEGSD